MNKRNVILIVIVFLIILGILGTMFYINLNNNKPVEVEATVKLIGNNYIIVEDSTGEEYSIDTNEEYNIGDRIDFVIKDIENDSNPKSGTIVKIDVISRNIIFSITDNNNSNDKETIKENSSNTNDDRKNNTNKDNVETNSSDVVTSSTTDTEVITYFTNLDNNLDNYNQDKSIGKKLKEGFVTVVDFLFYDGEIKGKTFDELSNAAKIKVLQIAFSIDEKIDKYFPGYKEEISTTSKKIYTSVKSKATELYLNITASICEKDATTCEAAKEGLSDLKTNFSLTWDFIKDIGTTGLNKLKEWYEIWKMV